MPEWISDAKIAAANNNAAGLALVTALTTSPVIPFVEPRTIGGNWRGAARVSAGTGQIRRAGFKRAQWVSSQLWVIQYAFLIATYESLNGGQVTIRHTFNGVSWANYNAVLDLGDLGDYEVQADTQYGFYVSDFIWRFSRLEAL